MGRTGSIARLAFALAVLALSGPATATVGVAVSQGQAPATPVSGEAVGYLITVVNTGDEVLTDMLVMDTIAPQVTAATTDQDPLFAVAVTQGATGTVYAWSATGLSMAWGDSFTFTITGTVGVTCGTALVGASVWVSASTGVTPAEAAADPVSFPMGHSYAIGLNQAITAGQVNHTITLVNTGTATVMDLTVTDTVPAGAVVFATVEPAPFGPPAVTSVPGSGTRFTWSALAVPMAPQSILYFTISATAGCSPVSLTMTVTASVTGGTGCGSATAVSPAGLWVETAASVWSVAPYGWPGDGWVVLTWSATAVEVGGEAVGYQVWRSADAINYAPAGTASVLGSGAIGESDTRAFWDRGLVNGVSYSYRLQVLGACGASAYSDPPVVVMPMTTTALVDSGKSGTVFAQPGDGYAKLSWTSNPFPGELGANSFNIWRGTTAAGPFAQIPLSPVTNASFTFDSGLANMQAYWYMVFPCCPERRPSFLSVVPYRPASGHGQPLARMDPSGPRAVRLTWPPATPGSYAIVGYAIYRSDDGGGTLARVGTVGAGTYAFVDLTVPTYGKRYVYVIRPIDSAGNVGDAYPTVLIDVVLPTNRTYLNRNRIRPARGEVLEIVYQVTEPGRVRVSIWTQAGELVAKLFDGDLRGPFTVDTPYNSHDRGVPPILWNGTNDRGELVGSGVYLVVLEVNGKRDFRTEAVLR